MKRFSPQDVPSKPGVYLFRNSSGNVIYVGKAKSLRKRLSTYFQPSRSKRSDVKARALINSIDDYDYFEVKSETEALLLESRLIKQYHPRYNTELRDDKRFLHIVIDRAEDFPRLQLVRIRKNDGRKYFGPFPHAGALRDTVSYLSKYFGLRTCRGAHPDPAQRRHCLEHVFESCSSPCVGEISEEEYAVRLDGAVEVLNGEIDEVVSELSGRMEECAGARKYEEAAKLRDMIENFRSVYGRDRRFARATLMQPRGTTPGDPEALGRALGLTEIPARIECFDISNIGGRMAVGSLVSFLDGRPDRKEYRRYRIKSPEASDDTARIKEVVDRRCTHLLKTGKSLPDLIVIDGGKTQLGAAVDALRESAMPPVPVLALAKKREEVFLPGRKEPLVLSRHDAALKLLQAVRDEAHRFALDYHRKLRRRRIADSQLSEIPGVGPKRRAVLLREFGSVRKIRKKSPQEIAERIPGLGSILAEKIYRYLNEHRRRRNRE